ncbi:MAG: cytochrome oxidase assembly [Actinotalea sp.]|nr:cytochrome oxidase assembly [Actinotalea sp.]
MWARRILLANLVGQVLIVVTGGVVRLTGSGLGCSTWPECEPGRFTPVMHDAVSWHPLIEFGNRTLSGVLVALGLATAWTVWRARHRALPYRLLGLVPLAGVLVQAVVGGLTVLVDLHPAVVGGHFLISMALVAASTALLRRHAEGDGAPQPVVAPLVRTLSWAVAASSVVVLVLGVVVTGSGPHSGDEEVAYRFALDPVAISRMHAAAVWLYVAGVVALVVLTGRAGRSSAPAPGARRAAVVLLGVTLLQGLVGYVQYLTGLPAVLVAVHMLGASLLVVAQVRQLLSLRVRGAGRRTADPVRTSRTAV